MKSVSNFQALPAGIRTSIFCVNRLSAKKAQG